MVFRAEFKARINRHEGRRRFPYLDTKGNTTIGVGHNLTANGLPESLIDDLLDLDLTQAWTDLTSRFPWVESLPRDAQEVLTELCFNLGITGLSKFVTTLRLVKQHDFPGAANQLLKAKIAKDEPTRIKELARILAGVQ